MRAMLARSRDLEQAYFRVPVSLYRDYLRQKQGLAAPKSTAPVPMIAEEGVYQLIVAKDRAASLQVTVRLRVFDPAACRNLPVLSAVHAWEKLTVNGKESKLATVDGWLRFTPDADGLYEIAAEAPLKTVSPDGGTMSLAIPQTVRTFGRFDSPLDWEVRGAEESPKIAAVPGKGTSGQIALTPRGKIELSYRPPQPVSEHPPRYEVRGSVAWNLDVASQQVSAVLNVALVGGRSDRIDLVLPAGADRVSVTGPDVREAQAAPGGFTVHLRGKISGRTSLNLSYELPLGRNGLQEFTPPTVRDGHWAGGVLVVTNTAGGGELLPNTMTGLKDMAMADIPSSASAILAGPAILAYEVSARDWSIGVERLSLGEFALRESIADLAHYELFFSDDGSIFCKASYEVRNRNRQFLKVTLPPGSCVLMSRVNEKSQPLSPAPGEKGAWLLPLVRSLPSVKGLVSFPVEIVFIARPAVLKDKGTADIPLPVVDLPIAYAWSQVYVADGLAVKQWSGPLRRVESFSSEQARASLDYGRGEAAEGYTEKARPTVGAVVAAQKPPEKSKEPTDQPFASPQAAGSPYGARRTPAQTAPATQPTWQDNSVLLARNYYRAGRDYYDRGDYANAAEALEQAVKLAPGSVEATNASRLIANTKMLAGKLQLKTKSEIIAGFEVQKGTSALNKRLEEEQQQYVEEGLKAAREGKGGEAKTKFKAAEALGKQIVSQGGQEKEVAARLVPTKGELMKVQKKEQEQAQKLREELGELKKSGQYTEAFQRAKALRDLGGDSDKDVGAVQMELDDLAVKANKEQQYDQRIQAAKAKIAAARDRLTQLGQRDKEAGDIAERDTQEDRKLDVAPPTKEHILNQLEGRVNLLESALSDLGHKPPVSGEPSNQPDVRVKTEGPRINILSINQTRATDQPRPGEGQSDESGRGRAASQPSSRGVAGPEMIAQMLTADQPSPWGAARPGGGPRQAGQGMDQVGTIRASQQVRVLKLSHGDAQAVADTLSKLWGGTGAAGGGRGGSAALGSAPGGLGPQIAADPRSNSLVVSGSADDLRKVVEVLSQLETAAGAAQAPVQPEGARREGTARLLGTPAGQVGVYKGTKDGDWSWFDEARRRPAGQDLVSGTVSRGTFVDDLHADFIPATQPATVTRAYDVRDLLVRVPNFAGPNVKLGANEQQAVQDPNVLIKSILETVDRRTGAGTVTETNGRLVVADTAENQKVVTDLLDRLRQARGPQVQLGEKIAQQEARGLAINGPGVDTGGVINLNDGAITTLNAGTLVVAGQQNQLQVTGSGVLNINTASAQQIQITLRNGQQVQQFIARNYDWANAGTLVGGNTYTGGTMNLDGTWSLGGQRMQQTGQGQGQGLGRFDVGGNQATITQDELLRKLIRNRGQKVTVNSVNLNADVSSAASLGVQFVAGNNDVKYALIDEAQYRTLVELDARNARAGKVVADNNGRVQDTIVGTDALLANGWTANVTFAGDRGNTLDVNGNPLAVPHENYVAVVNDGYLTVIRAGQMRHWTERQTELMPLAEVPQTFDAPRVGQMHKFEKSLVKPSEVLVIRVDYTWKGASQ